jgi:hypothetical protein
MGMVAESSVRIDDPRRREELLARFVSRIDTCPSTDMTANDREILCNRMCPAYGRS